MKTLVMFEAFGGKLKSEPEIYDLLPGQMEINLPFRGEQDVRAWREALDPSQYKIKVARFRQVNRTVLPNWEFPIRVYRLVDI